MHRCCYVVWYQSRYGTEPAFWKRNYFIPIHDSLEDFQRTHACERLPLCTQLLARKTAVDQHLQQTTFHSVNLVSSLHHTKSWHCFVTQSQTNIMSTQARGLQNFISDLRNAKSKVRQLAIELTCLLESWELAASLSNLRVHKFPNDICDVAS